MTKTLNIILIILGSCSLFCSFSYSDDSLYHFFLERYNYGLRIERLLIEKYPELIKRTENKLIIILENGNKKEYEDDDNGYWSRYTIIDYFDDINYILLRWHAYGDSGSYILLDRKNGKEIEGICDIPIFSKNKDKFIAISKDLQGYHANEINIYNLKSKLLEYCLVPKEWGPIHAEWINETEIKIIKKYGYFLDNEKEEVSFLKFINGNWVMKE